ncbi:MAG: 3-hydroxyacyl-CoA dehydrogenase NAD-binding domain-containing protein [Candidatus Aminicenantales bacterium]
MEQGMSWDDVEVLVIGPGLMGSNIAQAYAQNGLSVGLIGRSADRLQRSLSLIEGELEDGVTKGVFTRDQVDGIKRRILLGSDLLTASRGRKLQIVIEAITEDFHLKRALFENLDAFCGPAVVLASTTSCLDAEVLAQALQRPERFIWMHFFFPAHKNKAGEIAPLARTSQECLAVGSRSLEAARKDPVHLLRYRKGGAANVIFVALLLEAARLMEEGFSPAGVEQASREAFSLSFGFASFLSRTARKLAASCLSSFSDDSHPDHPFHRVYENFFSPPPSLLNLEGILPSFAHAVTGEEKSIDAMALDYLRRRFLAVAFMTATEVVEAGLLDPWGVDKLCRMAFAWPQGPFGLMNRMGLRESLRIVTEKMELSHRREINFPVPRLLIEQARKNEPWPEEQSLSS